MGQGTSRAGADRGGSLLAGLHWSRCSETGVPEARSRVRGIPVVVAAAPRPRRLILELTAVAAERAPLADALRISLDPDLAEPHSALAKVISGLSALPETRALPIVIAADRAHAGAAIAIARQHGSLVRALIVPESPAGEFCLTPTCESRDAATITDFLDQELGDRPSPSHRGRRRDLKQRILRRIGSCPTRGIVGGGRPIGLTLAGALAFTILAGAPAERAEAAFTGSISSGTLGLTDDGSNSVIRLDCDNSDNVLFTFSGANDSTTMPGLAEGLNCTEVGSIIADGKGGNDTIDLGDVDSLFSELEEGGVSVQGDGGLDVIDGPRAEVGGEFIGGDDSDVIRGSRGEDVIEGGLGDDTLDGDPVGGADLDQADDEISGGPGTDRLVQFAPDTPISFTIADDGFSGSGDDGIDSIELVSLTAGALDDEIDGEAFSGPMVISGGSGNDTIAGGPSADLLQGAAGSDRLVYTGGGNQTLGDTLHTAGGISDTLSGFLQASLEGSGAAETIDASAFTRPTTLAGNGGADELIAAATDASDLSGGTGVDTLTGSTGADTLSGGGGTSDLLTQDVGGSAVLSDSSLVSGATDELSGIELASLETTLNAGSFDASAFSGSVTLIGGTFSDTMIGAAGNDSLDAGAGGDYLLIDAGDITVSDSVATGAGTDQISGFAKAVLTGDSLDNLIDASAASFTQVTLYGGGGDDTLLGSSGSGNDQIRGEGGQDQVSESSDASEITITDTNVTPNAGAGLSLTSIERVSLAGGGSANEIDASGFTAGDVTIAGGLGNDTVLPGAGDDSLAGGGGTDEIEVLQDGDHLLTDSVLEITGRGDDVHSGFELASLRGGAGDNSLDGSGASFPVSLSGGSGGTNTVQGGSASDLLDGGTASQENLLIQESNDTLQNLTTNQVTGAGVDTINDFKAASLIGGPGPNEIDATGFDPPGLESVSISAGAGADDLTWAAQGTFLGEGGNDTLNGPGVNSSISGGADDDSIEATSANSNSTLAGDGGADVITAPSGTPALFDAGPGNDTVTGDGTLLGDSGNDSLSLTAIAANRSVDGGAGTDTLRAIAGDVTLTSASLEDPGDTVPLANLETASIEAGLNGIDASGWGLSGVTLEGGVVTGSPQNDSIDANQLVQTANADHAITDTLATGTGSDTLLSVPGSAVITGGAGPNEIDVEGFSGNVTVDGAGADDTLLGGTHNTGLTGDFTGGGGTDLLSLVTNATPFVVSDSNAGAYIDGIENVSVQAGAADNYLRANAFTLGSVTLAGGGGSDTLIGSDQADLLAAGPGYDSLSSSAAGDQTLTDTELAISGAATDQISGFDVGELDGDNGDNELDAGGASFPVFLNGRGGNDTLEGGAGDDTLEPHTGTDLVRQTSDAASMELANNSLTGRGNDSIIGSSFELASLTGGPSANEITTNTNSTIDADGGDDLVVVTESPDLVSLGTGNDTVQMGGAALSGSDTILGGAGTDQITSEAAGQTLDDDSLARDGQVVEFQGGTIEQASLTGNNLLDAGDFSGPVTISGFGGGDTLIGGAADDSLISGGGLTEIRQTTDGDQTITDSQVTGKGNDTLSGPFDTARLSGEAIGGVAGQSIDASGFSGFVTLEGRGGGDTLRAAQGTGIGSQSLDGGNGLDIVVESGFQELLVDAGDLSRGDGGFGPEQIDLNAIEGASLIGTAGADTLGQDTSGSTFGSMTLVGLGGGDELASSSFQDSLAGGEDADTLDAGLGGDTLSGGPGDDLIEGGTGGSGSSLDLLAEETDADLTLSGDPTSSTLTGLGSDSVTGVEAASLTGDAGPNLLDASGFAGPVSLTGLGDADALLAGSLGGSLVGGAGEDTHTGGAGDDTINSRDTPISVDVNDCLGGDDTVLDDDVDQTGEDCENRDSTDTTPPETQIDSGPGEGESVATATVTFSFSADEPGATFSCTLDGNASPCNSGTVVFQNLANGPHTFSVAATDSGNNTDPTPAERNFTVDVPDPPDPPDPDTAVRDLDVTAKKKQKQKGKKIKLKISVGAQEQITAIGTGKVKTKKPKKSYRLKPQTKTVEGGERTILKLKPKSKKDAKKIGKAIKKWKKASRKQKKKLAVKAPVKIVATDEAGNTATEKRVVTLK